MANGRHPHGPGGHHGANHTKRHAHMHTHDQKKGGGGGGGGGMSDATLEQLQAELRVLKDQIARAKKKNNAADLARLRAQRERIKKQIKALGGNPGPDGEEPPPTDDPNNEGDGEGDGAGDEEPDEDEDDTTPEKGPNEGAGSEASAAAKKSVLDYFRQFLADWGLPEGLMAFVQEAIVEGKSQDQIAQELYRHPDYLSVFPEGELRRQAGLSWVSAAQIRSYREDVRRIAKAQGIGDLGDMEIARLLTKDVSPSEWEDWLKTFQNFKRWGPTVRAVLEGELGLRIPDDRVFAFLSPEIATPDLDRAYEKALLRGQPALLGLGVRPEDEAEMLRRYGISPEQAFRGYQGIVAEMPAQDRFGAIEAEINRNSGQFPNGSQLFNDTPFALLFRAIQLNEGDAIRELQARLARETARFQAGGGAAQQGTQLVGLQGTAGPQ